jgi:hypothetical protein
VEAEPRDEFAKLEHAPRPPSIWDVMQRQVDRAFTEFLGCDQAMPPWWEAASGPGAASPGEAFPE